MVMLTSLAHFFLKESISTRFQRAVIQASLTMVTRMPAWANNPVVCQLVCRPVWEVECLQVLPNFLA